MRKVPVAVSIALVSLFVILSIQDSGIFKLHPSLMAVSCLGFMFHAIHIFSTEHLSRSSSLARQKQILIHSLLQIGSAICSSIAFIVCYINKERNNKPHFTSWHGFIGFVAFTWLLFQSVAGLNLTLLPRYIRIFKLNYSKIRIYHATSGVLLFTVSCFVIVLGLASNWFKSKMPNSTIAYYAIFYLLTSSILLLAHQCVEQVKCRYVKRR